MVSGPWPGRRLWGYLDVSPIHGRDIRGCDGGAVLNRGSRAGHQHGSYRRLGGGTRLERRRSDRQHDKGNHGHHATRCLRNWWVCSFRSSFRLLAREQVLVWNPREFLKPRVKGHLSVDKLFLTCGDTSKPVSSNWHLFSVRHGRRSAVAHPGTEINVVQMRTHTFPAQRRSRHTGLYTEVSSRERKRSNTWSRAARVGCPGSSMRCSVTTECGGIGEPGRADSPGSSIAMNASPSSSRRN